jgi:uracil-DNA glycosylase
MTRSETDPGGASADDTALEALAKSIRACRICMEQPLGAPLPHDPRPVLRVSTTARLLIASQAPGLRVHQSGTPFTDASGDRLRQWMGIGADTFYDVSRIAIVPMGFCFPGYDAKGSDRPPRRECRANWHDALFAAMPAIETILVVGTYAQDYHFGRLRLPARRGRSLAETVRDWPACFERTPRVLPLPHPSWRNTGWLKKNPWFETQVLPILRAEVQRLTET